MQKRIISMMAATALLFTVNISMPEKILAADTGSGLVHSDYDDYIYEGLSYIVDDNTVTITDCSDGVRNIDIPAQIDGMSVTRIDDHAFSRLRFLKSVTIPDSVTSVGEYVFYQCSSLTNVAIGSGLTKISDYMFSHCENLETVTISDSVVSIGEYAFEDCYSMTGIDIPDSVTSIGHYAFYRCFDLADVIIPDSVTNIGENVFEACGCLENITIDTNNSVYSSIDGVLFDKSQTSLILCPKAKSGAYEIPDSITNIYDNAFSNCSNLTSVTIPNGITSIGKNMFSDCTSLESVTIPDSVTSIGEYAFSRCRCLQSLTLPDNIMSIGAWAFEDCRALKNVTIPDSVTSIGDYSFEGCHSLEVIIIPDSVMSIGYGAFEQCHGLINITVSPNNSVYSSLDGVLFNKDQTSVIYYPRGKPGSYIIPEGVTNIGKRAFYFCSDLTSITIPDSVTSIGEDLLSGCRRLTSITVNPDNSVYSSIDGVLFDKAQTSVICYPGGKSDSYIVPDGVMSISEKAFYNNIILTNITIPDSVTSICDYAFEACYNLENVYYSGTKEQWDAINFGWENSDIQNATIHYNDEPTTTPTVNDWDYTIDEVTVEDGSVSVNLSRKSNARGNLVIALYAENGTLVGTKYKYIDSIISNKMKISVKINTDHVAYVKTFIWEDMTSMKPISERKVKVL